MKLKNSKSNLTDFLIPVVIATFLMLVLHELKFDEQLASHFYVAGAGWIYRDNFILEKILHKGGVLFGIVIITGIIINTFLHHFKTNDKKAKHFYLFVLVSTLMTLVAVFILKRWTTLPCPWNSRVFQGGNLIPHMWQMFSFNLPNPHCFPGGHSSGGFAYLSIYFGYLCVYGKRNFKLLLPGIILGVIFGLTQQIRGAHFISHDLATIIISILCSLVTTLIYSYYDINYEEQTHIC